MPCCSRKKTDGKEPQSIKVQSDQASEKIKPIPPQKSSNDREIEYLITIKTGDNQNSNTNGPVYIKLFGQNETQTDEILLTGPFKQDSITEMQIKAIDIGEPQRIIIRHEDKTNGWFVANRWLNESTHDRKLSVELFGSEQPAVDYDIEIRTGSEQIEPLDSPVYIQIYGTITTTPKLFLESRTTPFAKDSTVKFNIASNNVGEIQKIVIGHENLGRINDWYLDNIKVQTLGEQYEFSVHRWLSPSRDDKQLFIELTPQAFAPTLETYLIATKIVDIHRTNDIDNMQMSIIGSNGRIDQILLKNLIQSDEQIFRKGSLNQFELKEKDIGDEIESITIGFDAHEQRTAILFESIQIKYKSTVYHFRVDCWLSSRLGAIFTWITIKPEGKTNNINYKITIESGEFNINSNIILCIYGDEETTNNLALRTTKNGRFEFDLKAVDVGRINKINIGHDGKDNQQQWFLKSIEIEKKDEHYLFKAHQWLNQQTGTFVDLVPEKFAPPLPSPPPNETLYTITIVTSSENDSGTDSGVFMTIYGDKDQTKQFQLVTTKQGSDLLFKPGETKEFKVELNDVGNINKINIGQDGKGLHPIWHLQTIEIQKGSEIFKFHADQVLDLSIPDIDLNPVSDHRKKSMSSVSSKASQKKVKTAETTYKVSGQYQSLQQTATNDEAKLYLIIVGNNDQTEKLFLSNDKNSPIESTAADTGKISKILLGQDKNSHGIVWYVENLTIKRGNETTLFKVDRFIEQGTEIEVLPSPADMSSIVVKTRDVFYEIKTTTGEKTFEGNVIAKIRGEFGTINIPLSKTVSGEKPFQSKAVDVFTSRTNDVGKIKRLTLETNETRPNQDWNLKRIQIIKGAEVYHFNANIHLDCKEQKMNLYPITKKKEDYVQSELRRLRESLRSESTKMRRPPHKAHEPFVYNDLSPYFDTTSVERAIHEPLETPPGYYTRVTALRVVEPWEAHGMDYGVSYELLKHRSVRGQSAKRLYTTQTGLITLPPLSLPYGGQITYVNPVKSNRSRASSFSNKRQFSAKRNTERVPMMTTTA